MKHIIIIFCKWILIAYMVLCFAGKLEATHLKGGELTYRYLYTNNNKAYYQIRLVIYRNCYSPAGFADSICMGLYKGTNFGSIATRSVSMNGSAKDISPKCSSSGICMEEAIYIDTLNFPVTQSYGIYVTCGGTERDMSTVNLNLVSGNAGIAWQIYIPPPSQYINSSPQFTTKPLAYIFTGKQTIYNNSSAYDADGDSLVFSFVVPYSSNNPGGGCPISGYPVPPPLSTTTCNWASGFSVIQPFGSNGFIAMDSFTGEITATSPSSNNFVLAIQIDEYRTLSNGTIISMGEIRRDLQILSVSNANYYPPVITNYGSSTNKTIYAGKNNCFNISGVDSLGDSLTISASGIMFDSAYLGSSSLASFNTKSDDSAVTQQFCWNPSCSQVSNTPYILTIDLIDKNCNRSQKTFNIIVDTLWSDSITANICTIDTFNFNGTKLTAPGTYVDSFVQSACNTNIIVTLTLIVNNTIKSLGNISGQQNVYMHDKHIYSVNNTSASGFVWTVTGGTIISGQGTNAIKVLWDTAVTGSISVYANCYDTSNLNIYITNSINSISQQSDIRIYPNPSEGSFNINFNNSVSTKSELSIYNSLGQKVYHTFLQTGTNQHKVELENVPKGFYYMYINAAENSNMYRILIK